MYKIRREQQKQQQTHFRQLSFDDPQIYKNQKQENNLKVPLSKIFRKTQFIEDYNLYSNRNHHIGEQSYLLPRSKGLYSQFSDDAETGYIEQLTLKNQAIEKASRMIILLKEENDELKIWKQKMQSQLQIRQKQVQSLKAQLKRKQQKQEQNKVENNLDHNKTIVRGLNNDEKNKVNQNMIFSFTRQKDTIKKQVQLKIINIDDQSYKYNISAISNKLQEYKSNIEDQVCGFTLNKLYQNLSLTIGEQNLADQLFVQQINNIINEEEEIFKDYQIKMESQKQYFSDQIHSKDLSNSQANWLEIVTLLQNCIEQYRQYSSYLRAYLCESINLIHDLRIRNYQNQNECLQKQKYTGIDFWQKIQSKLLNCIRAERRKKDKVTEENLELKEIIDELVENIQKTNLLNNH